MPVQLPDKATWRKYRRWHLAWPPPPRAIYDENIAGSYPHARTIRVDFVRSVQKQEAHDDCKR